MAARQAGIELGRLAAIVAVITIHAGLPAEARTQPWYELINQLARFGVPFFFIAMGYFAKPELGLARIGRTVLILLALYAVWFVVYGVAFNLKDPVHFAKDGGSEHLWFLPAAALSLAFVALLRQANGWVMLAVSLALYVAGLAFGSYSPLLFGHDLGGIWNTRDGITFGAPFIAIGVLLARHRVTVSPLAGALLFAGTALLQIGEVWSLSDLAGIAPTRHDFVIATLPYGLAAFLFFQSLAQTALARAAAPLGALVLGVYLVHPALIRVIDHLYQPDRPLVFWPYIVVILAVSLAVVAVMRRVPVVRALVSTSGFPIKPSAPAEPKTA